MRFPSSLSGHISTLIVQTCSPALMHNLLLSSVLLSLIPLSMTLAISIAFAPGGPPSYFGLLIGNNSAPTIKIPSLGVSGKGFSTVILIPAMTSVFPHFTSAVSIRPVFISIALKSSFFLPSYLTPFSRHSIICFFVS